MQQCGRTCGFWLVDAQHVGLEVELVRMMKMKHSQGSTFSSN